MRREEHAARMCWLRHTQFFGRNAEGKRQLAWLRRRQDDNFKVDRTDVGCEGVNWIHPAQDSNLCTCNSYRIFPLMSLLWNGSSFTM